jgi:hypothetical protein
MVLTERDYLDFGRAMADHGLQVLLPAAVRDALADDLLLLVGYSASDWNLRLLLRESVTWRSGVAVQLAPDVGSPEQRRVAEEYLRDYYRDVVGVQLDVYYGRADEFGEALTGALARERVAS